MHDTANHRGVIYPWQCDQMSHLNVMWYMNRFDEASWTFIGRIGLTPMYIRDSDCGPAVVRHVLSYNREVLAGDIIEITTELLELGHRSLRFLNAMRVLGSDDVVADCETTAVHFDRQTRRSKPWPKEIRSQAAKWLRTHPPKPAGG